MNRLEPTIETKNAENIYAIAEVEEHHISLYYLVNSKKLCLEIPITGLNNHIKTGDKVDLSLYIQITGE